MPLEMYVYEGVPFWTEQTSAAAEEAALASHAVRLSHDLKQAAWGDAPLYERTWAEATRQKEPKTSVAFGISSGFISSSIGEFIHHL